MTSFNDLPEEILDMISDLCCPDGFETLTLLCQKTRRLSSKYVSSFKEFLEEHRYKQNVQMSSPPGCNDFLGDTSDLERALASPSAQIYRRVLHIKQKSTLEKNIERLREPHMHLATMLQPFRAGVMEHLQSLYARFDAKSVEMCDPFRCIGEEDPHPVFLAVGRLIFSMLCRVKCLRITTSNAGDEDFLLNTISEANFQKGVLTHPLALPFQNVTRVVLKSRASLQDRGEGFYQDEFGLCVDSANGEMRLLNAILILPSLDRLECYGIISF
ncbi:uncharacterized protein KY384_003891 [Bacidia gigantensis]|uniref:uncharacterized protein n=1 Tax=Bacidia gigantensis TaxID=2732470 RepID=UPI001D03FD6B|nr:uncharacterized protein KY384_003891 [Bacidia gigantensis]KAG8532250.1 hypothetical protein KY384_003891 [Bacidia gigantensis]